jgi:hypothetical protein
LSVGVRHVVEKRIWNIADGRVIARSLSSQIRGGKLIKQVSVNRVGKGQAAPLLEILVYLAYSRPVEAGHVGDRLNRPGRVLLREVDQQCPSGLLALIQIEL